MAPGMPEALPEAGLPKDGLLVVVLLEAGLREGMLTAVSGTTSTKIRVGFLSVRT